MANTVAAKSWPKNFQLAYALTLAPEIIHMEVKNLTVMVNGAAVILDTGEVDLALSTSGTLFGIALAGLTGDGTETVPVAVGSDKNMFIGQADAATSAVVEAAECDIIISTDYFLDIGSSVEDVIRIVTHVLGDDQSDATDPGRLYFQIKRSSFNEYIATR